jgi:excisionase family DNA binding protein
MKLTITVEVDDDDMREFACLLSSMQTQSSPEGTDRPPVLLTILEAAEALRVGRCTLQELVLSGALDSIQIGSRRLIPGDALDRYIDDRRSAAKVMAAERPRSGN